MDLSVLESVASSAQLAIDSSAVAASAGAVAIAAEDGVVSALPHAANSVGVTKNNPVAVAI